MNGKGDKDRTINHEQYSSNYGNIFEKGDSVKNSIVKFDYHCGIFYVDININDMNYSIPLSKSELMQLRVELDKVFNIN